METKKQEIIKAVVDLVPTPTRYAYYVQPINGGWQLHRLTIQEDIVLADERIEDPDGWPEVIGYLEAQFSLEHFSK